MTKRVLSLSLVLVLASCQHLIRPPEEPQKPPQPPAQPPAEIAYEPGALDLKAAAGRVICIDPGHGGPWPGAIAPSNGLREADVNLNVSRLVQRMLAAAGANVFLTRETDTALVPDSLPDDLAARAMLATERKADIFVSIHHNADIAKGSTKNDLEVYYKLREDGASLDLAQCLTRELARRLNATATAKLLLPGNYKVLRLSQQPAVLVESSYMTFPQNAELLASNAAIIAEAEAIASGIASYFALDPPSVASVETRPSDDGRAHRVHVRFARGLPIDMSTVMLLSGERALPGTTEAAEAGFVWTSSETLPNGILKATMVARNRHGAGISTPIDIAVSRPAARIEITQLPAAVESGSDMEVLLEARVTDALGMPCADGQEVSCEPLKEKAPLKNGIARFYVRKPAAQTAVAFACGNASAQHTLVTGSAGYRTIRVSDSVTKGPVPGVVVTAHGRTVGVTTGEGWLATPVNVDEIRLARDGYDDQVIRLRQSHTSIALSPVEGGALLGKVIVIDPAGGGRDPGVTGPTGARSSDLALDVGRRVAGLLSRAGATVYMTRYGDTELSEPQRVARAEEVHADLLVSVAFGARAAAAKALDDDGYQRADLAAYVGHYPNSAKGAAIAGAVAEKLTNAPATPSVSYVVQQTGCPSILVQPADITDAGAESRFRISDERRAIAEKICAGIVKYYRSNGGA